MAAGCVRAIVPAWRVLMNTSCAVLLVLCQSCFIFKNILCYYKSFFAERNEKKLGSIEDKIVIKIAIYKEIITKMYVCFQLQR